MAEESRAATDLILVQGLRKAYGRNVAVDGVSFEIRRGETFGLLGPNGAGKSTTLHLLAGLLRPDAGTIRITGSDGDPRRSLGLAPQSLSLYPDLSADENCRFFGRLYGLSGARLKERTDAVLELAGLTERRRDRVQTFSGGMQRRLNLACALIHDPPFLLLDEPTAGVDPQSRNHVFDSIEALKRRGTTLLYTTHYMEEAQRLCDRVAILDRGRILALDPVDRLIESHGGGSVIEAELARAPENPRILDGSLEGLRWRLETRRPFEDLARAVGAGVTFQRVRVDRPDLESVFLSLTGRTLRDE
jgi:ABC-2 type transport system ATP-binding protein